MDTSIKEINTAENLLNEPSADYEKAEMDLLRDALRRTYTERFLFATRLYKIQQTLHSAKITHKPYTPVK
ncbi:MAG: hypothetical protein H7Z13_13660 [Ferruginibacter sp.]|nr:hypothetical protein [Ferruginibacter sp.]